MEFLSTQTGSAKRAAIAIAVCAAAFAGTVEVNAQNWKGTQLSSLTDGTKVYLYSVGSKEFVGIGGRWGTQAMVSTVGLPFEVASKSGSTIQLKSTLKGEVSGRDGYLTFMDGKVSEHDTQNFFVDQYNATTSVLTLSLVSSTDSKYIYNITVSGQSDATYSDTYYLTNVDNTLLGESTADDTNSQWIIVTQAEREEYFKAAEAGDATSVPGSFLIDNQGFARNNALTSWYVNPTGKDYTSGSNLKYYSDEVKTPADAIPSTKTTYTHTYTGTCSSGWGHAVTITIENEIDGETQAENTPTYTTTCGTSHGRYGVESTVTLSYSSTTSETTTNEGYTYYVGNGLTDTNVTYDPISGETVTNHNLQQEYGGDWTANIHGTTGKAYQTITPLREGWYKISCVGFTTATEGKAQLFAQVADNTTEGKKYAVEDLANVESTDAPATYVAASKLINDNDGYDRSVMVYVAKTTSGLESLTFGINVADANDAAWTCFDNFQLEYFGNPSQTLVLDEQQTDVAYINNQRKGLDTDGSMTSDDFTGQRTLYLNRTLNENAWNSIVLPVNLTVSQVKSAFGDGVRISEFKGATDENRPGTIIFTAISANRENGTELAIKAGNLYLIKPSSTAAYVTGDEVTANGSSDVKISTYYTIPQVVFNPGADYESGRIEGSTGDETYEGDTQVKFVGTLVQLGDDNKIPTNSYVLNGNNKGGTAGVWYYRTKETASKGFRGWLETTKGSSNKLVYEINGVEETVDGSTTSIDNVLNESKAQNLSGAVYTLSGQMVRSNATSLANLPSGIYVVGGQKVVVK